uniref:WAPL domain-containing protein n=1 Tax=Caenorhabditis tropicalis TaxID=1561998 RepID=A0A1I7V3X1_9PELO
MSPIHKEHLGKNDECSDMRTLEDAQRGRVAVCVAFCVAFCNEEEARYRINKRIGNIKQLGRLMNRDKDVPRIDRQVTFDTTCLCPAPFSRS